jgi:type VI secretion system protein ImpH
MAPPIGRQDPPVADLLQSEPYRFAFFQAVRLLERRDPARAPVGGLAHPVDEVARFHSWISLAFPPSEVMGLEEAAQPGSPPDLMVAFMGLIGPNAPLPTAYTELLQERLARGDSTLSAFLDLFHHRMISFFYRSWEKYRPAIAHERDGTDPLADYLLSLIGLGLPALRNRMARPDASLLPFAGVFAQHHRPAIMLEAWLSQTFRVPIHVETFVSHWLTLEDDDRTQLTANGPHNRLGSSVIVGRRTLDEQGRFRLRVGPLSLDDFRSFLPGERALANLVEYTRFYVGSEYLFDVQLVLRAEEAPPCQLRYDPHDAPQLGRTAWVRTRPLARDPDDLCLVADAR